MPDYAEIDRKQGIYVQDANLALALPAMREKGGRWWDYMVSHRTFELVVGDCQGKDNIVFRLTACNYIAGPISWDAQNLEVIWANDRSKHGSWEFTLQDEDAGFKVIANTFGWYRNYDILGESRSRT